MIAAREDGRPRVLPPLARERRGTAMPAILALSLAVHVAVIAAAALLAQAPGPAAPAEVAVEVVPEIPRTRAERDEAAKAEQPQAEQTGAAQAAAQKVEQAKRDEPPEATAAEKAEQARAEQARTEQAKAEQSKADAERARQAQAEAEQARAEQARAEQARAEQARAEQAKAEQAKEQAKEQSELQSMRDELARLQAEQQALQAAQGEPPMLRGDTRSAEAPATQSASRAAGVGPLASSFQAIALPQETTDGEGELAGYQAVVFSRLAKAKAVGRQLGIPGSAGVAFTVDERGALKSLRLAVPSGIRKLDEEALAIVRRAAPFPAPPEGAQRAFEANVSFIAGG